jgi:hypothetical protein
MSLNPSSISSNCHNPSGGKFISGILSVLLLCWLGFSSLSLQAQPGGLKKYYSTNKSAIRDFEDGRKQYDSRQDVKAIKLMESAIQKDSNFY